VSYLLGIAAALVFLLLFKALAVWRDRDIDRLFRGWVKKFGTCPICAYTKWLYQHGGKSVDVDHDCEEVIAFYSEEKNDGHT